METAELKIEQQIANINRKLDFIMEEMMEQKLQKEKWNDLEEDVTHVSKEVMQSATEMLEDNGVQINSEAVTELLVRAMRNIDNINTVFDLLESATDLAEDAGRIIQLAGMDITEKITELDHIGYFRFLKELGYVGNRVVQHFSAEDIHALGDNVVYILETVKRITQPDMLQAINNAIIIFKSVETENVPEMGLWKMMRELNTPEAKRGLGFLVTFLKNFGENNTFNQTIKK